MVKASSSQRNSSPSCPPLASLSLASTPLKPCTPSPFLSFLKHPPLLHTQPMDPPSSPSSTSECLHADSSTMDNLSFQQRKTESADIPSSLAEDTPSVTEPQSSMCSRQRLQQHRIQMSGKVIIPDTWGREQQLQEWVSCGVVEDALRPADLVSAQTALVSECQHRKEKPVRTSPTMSADVEVS